VPSANVLAGKRIFIVEDSPLSFSLMMTALQCVGAIVGVERWGITLLERLAEFAPVDLIILDLIFPNGITGYELFDLMRSVPELADVPIVAVSAADPGDSISKSRQKGFAGFIGKPIDFDEFPYQIDRILNYEEIWIRGE
jgi:two-component system, cell cycle response regulator DivK